MRRVLHKARRCCPRQQDSPPRPKTPPDTPCAYDHFGGVCLRFRLCTLPQKNLLFFASLRTGQYQTVTANSRRLSSAPFDGDVGYVVTDAYLLCRRVATRGRGCRPQRRFRTKTIDTSCHIVPAPQPPPTHQPPSRSCAAI